MAAPKKPEKLYRTAAAAKLLDISPPILRLRVAEGSVNAIYLSTRAIRISESELLRIQREGLLKRKAAAGA